MKKEEMIKQAREDYKKGKVITEKELFKRIKTTKNRKEKNEKRD